MGLEGQSPQEFLQASASLCPAPAHLPAEQSGTIVAVFPTLWKILLVAPGMGIISRGRRGIHSM